jgi:hypothetical protein
VNDIVKIVQLKELIIEIQEKSELLDSYFAQIYGIETRDINKAISASQEIIS